MIRLILAGLRAHTGRLIATALAVLLAVGFVVATLTLSATFTRGAEEQLTANMASAQVIVRGTESVSDTEALSRELLAAEATVRGLDHVASAQLERTGMAEFELAGQRSYGEVTPLLDRGVRWQSLEDGRWPEARGEIALDAATAQNRGLALGDTLTLLIDTIDPGTGDPVPGTAVPHTLVGITETAADSVGGPAGILSAGAFDAEIESWFPRALLVAGGPGFDSAEGEAGLAEAVRSALPESPDVEVLTRSEAVTAEVAKLSGGGDTLTFVMLTFAAIALVVAGLVITNTFQVLVAQRTRELALLRTVGASRAQVRGMILGEAVVVGLLASILGVAAGIGASAGLGALSRSLSEGFTALGQLVVPPSAVVIGLILGTLLTFLAALPAAAAATRVGALEALREADSTEATSRIGATRAGFGIAFLLGGGAGLAAGGILDLDSGLGLLAAVAGGAVFFIGVLMLAPLFIPAAVRLAGRAISGISAPARLAAGNATRAPKRTTATASALLVGVTLVSMMMVGTESVRASVFSQIDERRPYDLGVLAPEGPAAGAPVAGSADGESATGESATGESAARSAASLSAEQVSRVAEIDNVRDVEPIQRSSGTIEAVGAPAGAGAGMNGQDEIQLRGVDPARALELAHSVVPVPETGTILLSRDFAETLGDPARVRVTGEHGTAEYAVRTSRGADYYSATLTPSDLEAIGGAAPVGELLLLLEPGLGFAQIETITSAILDVVPGASVGGGAAERVMYAQMLDTMLLIALALLAVAVVIALVGIGNTMALSVIERRRESALLRALGLTGRQLRGMLAAEAALTAVVAAVLGIGLGIFFGWIGISRLGDEAMSVPMLLSVPWGRVGLVALGALVAGVLASVAPARRAARESPVDALARG